MRAEAGSPPQRRAVIQAVSPEIDAGRFPIKRVRGDRVAVEADIFADGHDQLVALLRWCKEGETSWNETAMRTVSNDRWRGEFRVEEIGRYEYTITAWVDPFLTWQDGLRKKIESGTETDVDLLIGAGLVREAVRSSRGADRQALKRWAAEMEAPGDHPRRCEAALSGALRDAMLRYSRRPYASTYERRLHVVVDPERARFSAWYEMFPRSASPVPGRSGTFRDVENLLPHVAGMGFDVLYLPPIHPIGKRFRKGKNGSSAPGSGDPGSPWAIGSEEGGHKSVHPDLGTLGDFRRLVEAARAQGIEIALDIALQASPDHPYVKEHPEWFRLRPDGTIQYAENPPKKYQDIYPFDFESPRVVELWEEHKSIFEFWADQGVTIFRVDNPHTKSLAFWEWCIGEVKRRRPEAIFLSEAFTRPKLMYGLAKLGFSQSYTYFPWRNTAWEIREYLTEVTSPAVREFFRPNHWTNTPDILTAYLQYGGRAAFIARFVLAATLGASYGVYGPPFELMETRALREGSEEYLDSEKYEIRWWDREGRESLKDLIARVNRIRRENPALQSDARLRFHGTDNDAVLCYSKATATRDNVILVVVNLDPHHAQSAWLHLDLEEIGVASGMPYQVHDLLSDARLGWHGPRNFVGIDPGVSPAQIYRVRRHLRTEHDFEYYL